MCPRSEVTSKRIDCDSPRHHRHGDRANVSAPTQHVEKCARYLGSYVNRLTGFRPITRVRPHRMCNRIGAVRDLVGARRATGADCPVTWLLSPAPMCGA
jgi:hypothetical protein